MKDWIGKRVVILGLARQGVALTRYLIAQGARVTASDMNAQTDTTGLRDLPNLRFMLGEHPLSLLDTCDLLCLSGGVPIDLPIVLEAKRRGIPLSNDAQIFAEACPAPIIGITGSAGKTTTTTLVGEMLRAFEGWKVGRSEGWKVGRLEGLSEPTNLPTYQPTNVFPSNIFVGGNIGNPLISDVGEIRAHDKVVMELSSFQLELMTTSPHIACITNITPNHLDRHGTMDAYIAAKKHILDFQTSNDWQVLCADDPVTKTLNTHAKTAWFSINQEPQGDGAWMDEDGNLCLRINATRNTQDSSFVIRHSSLVICHRRELLLMGEHNILNVLAAATVSALAGASIEAIRQVATTFRGVAHRLQLVSELNGARWYDDSIATAPERLMAALKCFDQPVILLCGGRDKHLPWNEAAQLMLARCKHIILFGEMREMVRDELRTANNEPCQSLISNLQSLKDAVAEAKRIARAGDVVLLSPGGTSYDAFKDFAERGDTFREYVNG
jgi:UDP-N-acetylmuramoylalanine--D-glutamate ligase